MCTSSRTAQEGAIDTECILLFFLAHILNKMLLFLFFLFCFARSNIHNQAPNFIVILADDLGYNDLGSYGSPTIRTPHLNRMSREGIQFTQFYSAGSLCSPSRAAFLTGRLPIRTGVYTHLQYPLDNDFRVFYPSSVGCLLGGEITLAEYLRNSSLKYSCAMIGKNHIGHNPTAQCLPIHRGFDSFLGLPFSHEEGWPTYPEGLLWPPVPLYREDTIIEQPFNSSTLTIRYNQEILSLLNKYSETHQPFFIHYAPENPHVPLFTSPSFMNSSKRGTYGDAVQEVDDSVGQILQKLRDTGLDKNTLVVFASDNGAWVNVSSDTPYSGVSQFDGGCNGILSGEKGGTLEGGFRVVSLFWWPSRIQPGVSMEVASMLDIVPTFLELAGIQLPPNVTLDGHSLVPLLTGKNSSSPYTFFYYWRDASLYAIRYGPYKCHFYTRSGFGNDPPLAHVPCLLFQLEWDPSESFSLNSTQYQQTINVIETEYAHHLETITRGPSQLEDQDWSLIPCCQGVVNLTLVLHALEECGPGLGMWQHLGCIC